VARAGAAVLDRLDRSGAHLDALVLAARLDAAGELQRRLAASGAALLDAGRYELIRELVAEVPSAQRTVATWVLDVQAELDLEQLRPPPQPNPAGRAELLGRLAEGCAPGSDEALMVAGVRVEALRRRGDPEMVSVALRALEGLPALTAEVGASDLVEGRSAMARRGLHQVLHGLGVAATFSGDPGTVSEGRRLCELGFAVGESAGLDTAPVRGQHAYERVMIGLDEPGEALAPMEVGIDALQSLGRPEAANQLVQLADLHGRLNRPEQGLALLDVAREWAERTGNDLAGPSIDLARAGLELLARGPSERSDAQLRDAWRAVLAAGRLRRAAPGFAVRIANGMLDHGDTERCARWLERAAAAVGGEVQRGYHAAYAEAVEQRRRHLSGEIPLLPLPDRDGLFAAQPAGWAEAACTIAWDHLRAGDPGPAREVAARLGGRVPEPWNARLAPALASTDPDGAVAPGPSAGPALYVRLLCPSLAVEREGRPVPAPSGHAARLLALLVAAGAPVGIDALVEDLWPGVAADGAAARNRFHQVVHRLRRSLGTGPDGPVRVEGGVAWLDPDGLGSDVADLRALGGGRPEALAALLEGIRSELCAAQFAYDDAFDETRWELSQRIVDASAALLSSGWPSGREVVAALRARLPEDPRLDELLRTRTPGPT
jgi:hypothetical protein